MSIVIPSLHGIIAANRRREITYPYLVDDFNRADGALGANWGSPAIVGDTNCVIANNQIAGPTDYVGASSYFNARTFPANVGIRGTFKRNGTLASGGQYLGFLTAITAVAPSGFTGYILSAERFSGNSVSSVYRTNGGTYTYIGGSYSWTPGPADVLEWRNRGPGLYAFFVNGTPMSPDPFTTDPAPLTADGYVGVAVNMSDSVMGWDELTLL